MTDLMKKKNYKRKRGPVQAKKVTYNGIKFASGLERYMYQALKKAKIKATYEGATFEIVEDFMFDNASYEMIDTKKLAEDPNKFKTELKAYKDQLKSAKKKTKQIASLVSAHGKVNGLDMICSSFDFNFNGGTLSMQSGQNFYQACEYLLSSFF